MASYIQEQTKALDALQEEAKQQDPVLLALKGVVELLLARGGNVDTAVQWLQAAMRLGMQSQRLAELLNRLREDARRALEKRKGASTCSMPTC